MDGPLPKWPNSHVDERVCKYLRTYSPSTAEAFWFEVHLAKLREKYDETEWPNMLDALTSIDGMWGEPNVESMAKRIEECIANPLTPEETAIRWKFKLTANTPDAVYGR